MTSSPDDAMKMELEQCFNQGWSVTPGNMWQKSADISGCHDDWGRGLGCCQTSYDSHDSPTIKNGLVQMSTGLKARNTASEILQLQRKASYPSLCCDLVHLQLWGSEQPYLNTPKCSSIRPLPTLSSYQESCCLSLFGLL